MRNAEAAGIPAVFCVFRAGIYQKMRQIMPKYGHFYGTAVIMKNEMKDYFCKDSF
jgi:hypothetical protein